MTQIGIFAKTPTKRALMWAYCNGFAPAWFVSMCFRAFDLKGA